jgi:hypothetical protein
MEPATPKTNPKPAPATAPIIPQYQNPPLPTGTKLYFCIINLGL